MSLFHDYKKRRKVNFSEIVLKLFSLVQQSFTGEGAGGLVNTAGYKNKKEESWIIFPKTSLLWREWLTRKRILVSFFSGLAFLYFPIFIPIYNFFISIIHNIFFTFSKIQAFIAKVRKQNCTKMQWEKLLLILQILKISLKNLSNLLYFVTGFPRAYNCIN